jgi:hypothetical protein
MKKTLLFLFVFASFVAKSQIQYGGVIRAQDNTGAPGNIKRTNDALKTFDSSLASKLSGTLNVSGTFVPVNGGAIGTLTASDAVVGAPDGLGTIINGTSTAGSIVYMTMASGFQAWTLMIKGYTSGTVYTESSMNSTNGTDGDWVDLKGRRTGTAPGTESVTYAQVSNGVYRGNGAGFTAIRARLIGATGVGITFSSSNGAGAVFLNSGIPTGGSIIGKVGIDQTTPGTTNGVQITNPYTVLAADSSKYRGTIQISNLPVTQAVSGAFFQATQPISGSVGVTGVVTTDSTKTRLQQQVNVLNFPTNQTVSGTVSVNNFPASQPVSGTFFQTTQPISGTVATSNPYVVSATDSTKYRSTFQISNLPAVQAVNGTFFQTTQPVSLATNTPTIAAGTAIIGKVGIDQTTLGTTNGVQVLTGSTTAVTQATAANLNATVVGNGTFAVQNTAALPTGANTIGAISNTTFAATQATPANLQATVTQQAIIKGTQGTTGVSTQDLKDAGRNQVHYYMVIPVLTSATDALQSLTGTKSGATVLATATPAVVTAGKTFRVTRMAATYIATATSGYGIVRLRFNTAGVVTITSPVAATIGVGSGAPVTANATSSEEATLDEGWEFAAGTGVGISVQGFAAATATAVGYIFVSLTGYEY